MRTLAPFLAVCAAIAAGCSTTVQKAATGEWSDISDNMRGRLVFEPHVDDNGLSVGTVYLELQNLASTPYFRQLGFSRGGECLTWKLSNAGKEMLPRWKGSVPWIYDYAQVTFPISLSPRATIRLPVSSLTYHILIPELPHASASSKSTLVLEQDPPNSPWHLTSNSSAEILFLSATFRGAHESDDASTTGFWWNGELSLPPVRLTPNPRTPRHVR